MNYKLRQSAREDIKEIGRYTISEFGATQRDKYLYGLEAHFKKISTKPKKYKHRSDIGEGLYCSSYEQHIVFFKIDTDFIDILAVLHKRMLPKSYLYSRIQD